MLYNPTFSVPGILKLLHKYNALTSVIFPHFPLLQWAFLIVSKNNVLRNWVQCLESMDATAFDEFSQIQDRWLHISLLERLRNSATLIL